MPKINRNPKIQKGAWRALIIATLVLAVNFWAWSLLSPIGSDLEQRLSISSSSLALLLAIPVLLGSISRIFIGVLTDKFGARRMMIWVSLLTAIAVFYLTIANSFTEYILGALLLGIGGSIFAVGVPYVSRWFPKKYQGMALGLYTIGDAGTAFAGFTSPFLIAKFGWNSPFWVVSLTLVAMAIITILFARMPSTWRSESKTSLIKQLVRAIKHPLTIDMSLVYIVTFGAFIAFGMYLPVLLKTSYSLETSDAAARAAGFILLATFTRPIGGWLSDKLGGKLIIKISLIAIAFLAGYVAFAPTLDIRSTVAYLSLAAVLGVASGAVYALIGRLTKATEVGGISGVVGAIGGLGGFLPPIILGLTYQLTESYTFALVGLAIFALTVYIHISRQFKRKIIYKKAIDL